MIVILSLPVLACGVPAAVPPGPTSPSGATAPVEATSAPLAAVILWENSFSDANGWKNSPYWNTIQFPDVNHDGRADVCGRGIQVVYCGLSTGSAFQASAP